MHYPAILKKISLVLLFALFLPLPGKADTIDFWHIFYNKKKIAEFTEYSYQKVVPVSLYSIQKNDSISVHYFRDTPSEGPNDLEIYGGNTIIAKSTTGKRTGDTLSFSLITLLPFTNNDGVTTFEVYYSEKNRAKEFLFALKFIK